MFRIFSKVVFVFLWLIDGGYFLFNFEDVSPYKEPPLLLEKERVLVNMEESKHLSVVYDYCWKNKKLLTANPKYNLEKPFAGEFSESSNQALVLEENAVRDRLAQKFHFSNVYKLENSEELNKIAKFIAFFQLCFPIGNFNYSTLQNNPMDHVYHSYKHPRRYGLMKHIPWNKAPNTISLKVTFYEDYFSIHSDKVFATSDGDTGDALERHFILVKHLPAMYMNGMYNFSKDPHIGNLSWENGYLYDERVLRDNAGSHLVGYAYNGFQALLHGKDPSDTDRTFQSIYMMRVQLVAVYAYIYWDLKSGAVDNSYAGIKGQSCGNFYIDRSKSFEYREFKKKGLLKKFDRDINFKTLCKAYYDEPSPDYKDYVDPYPEYLYPVYYEGEECCYLCAILVYICVSLIAYAPVSYNKVRILRIEKAALMERKRKRKRALNKKQKLKK